MTNIRVDPMTKKDLIEMIAHLEDDTPIYMMGGCIHGDDHYNDDWVEKLTPENVSIQEIWRNNAPLCKVIVFCTDNETGTQDYNLNFTIREEKEND